MPCTQRTQICTGATEDGEQFSIICSVASPTIQRIDRIREKTPQMPSPI